MTAADNTDQALKVERATSAQRIADLTYAEADLIAANDTLRVELLAALTRITELEAQLPRLLPGQVAGRVLVGMSTDDFSARVAETGPIGVDHFFIGPGWDANKFMQKCELARSRGLLPYGNMKTGSWSAFGGSAGDAMVEDLGARLAAFGDPVRVTFHHEPGFKGKGVGGMDGEEGTAQQFVAMSIRQYPRLKSIAPNVVTGPVINGFQMSPNTNMQGLTFAQLNYIYTDAFLAAIDVFGGDYYDGAKTKTDGEPAYLKVQRCDQWLDSRGFRGCADIGEFSFVRPADMTAMMNFVKTKPERWWCILAFNSDNNNRVSIPTIGAGWNFTHDFERPRDRLDAFRAVLADPLSSP